MHINPNVLCSPWRTPQGSRCLQNMKKCGWQSVLEIQLKKLQDRRTCKCKKFQVLLGSSRPDKWGPEARVWASYAWSPASGVRGHNTTPPHTPTPENLGKMGRFGSNLVNFAIKSWWCHQMETFSALLALCAENSPVSGEFPAQRPVTRGFHVFFDLHLNKRLNKQSQGW